MNSLRLSIAAVLAVSAWILSHEAAAQSPDLLKAKGCTNCHDTEKKKVGPAFKDIAAKQKGKADEMAAKVSSAKGHPKVTATEPEVKAAVEQILSTK